MDERSRAVRWRLMLGSEAESSMRQCGCFAGDDGLSETEEAYDGALGFLYDREDEDKNIRKERSAGLDESMLSVPGWINDIHELFPKKTIERLEKDAIERYKIEEMVTDAEVLRRVEPNLTLAKAVLRTKHLMNNEVLAAARRLIRRVVEDLLEKLARPVRSPFLGALDPRRHSPLRVARNFDAWTTIRRNLKNYDPQDQRLVIEKPFFLTRVKRHVDRWQLIILVDQSGSMVGSVLHSAVMASIFWEIRDLRTHLVLFDTNVVDLTEDIRDPVETLMQVQLGGGTDIGQALEYGASLVEYPEKTIIILLTDFFEGAPVARLLGVARQLIESKVTLLGLAALDPDDVPNYDHGTAGRLVQLGAHVAAMTPLELAEWVAEKVR